MIKGLHHNAYRCRDSGETRQLIGSLIQRRRPLVIGKSDAVHRLLDFLGLPLAGTLEIRETKSDLAAGLGQRL